MEKLDISENLIADAIFAVTHLYLLEYQQPHIFVYLEPRFCPFSRFRFVIVIQNKSKLPIPRIKLDLRFEEQQYLKSENQQCDAPACVTTMLILPRDIAPGDVIVESLLPRFSEVPLIVSVSISLYHSYYDPTEASKLLKEEIFSACFTNFDVLLTRNQVDEIIKKDDTYKVFDDDTFIPFTTVTIKISAQNAVEITEMAFNELTATIIQRCLFPTVTPSMASFSGFVVVKQAFHRIFIEINKVVPWTDEAAFTIALLATSGTSYKILESLSHQIKGKIKFLIDNPPLRPVNAAILDILRARIDDCDMVSIPRRFDEPYAEEC